MGIAYFEYTRFTIARTANSSALYIGFALARSCVNATDPHNNIARANTRITNFRILPLVTFAGFCGEVLLKLALFAFMFIGVRRRFTAGG